MKLTYSGLATPIVKKIKSTGVDSYNLAVERHLSDGGASPCRHCLGATPAGEPYLILAHRPFEAVNAYTETGPIFLCAADCKAYAKPVLPDALDSATYLARGYTQDERIKYGTGSVVKRDDILDFAADIFADPAIAFVDVRSAMNNCWQGRITRNTD